MNALVKLLTEIGPLVIFFVVNGKWGIFPATAAFMVATLAAMIFTYVTRRKIPAMLWVSGAVVLVFGGATLYFENETFIKLKPTIIYGLFAGVLFFGLWRRQHYLKMVLDASFPPMAEKGWELMTRRWAWFFVASAALNEIIWRTQSTDTWVAAKLFLFLPLSFLFALAQYPLIVKYQLDGEAPQREAGE
ncbi:MAG: septation protein A [Alphaproteobacteria bacterium]|nr:MAG: septation protein A [Alphaproteobacteria bacterium]